MSQPDKPDCTTCHGTGKVTKTHTEIDTGASLVMGIATGTGFLPMMHDVTERETCPSCHGTCKQS